MTLEAKNVLRYTGLEYIITHEVTFFFSNRGRAFDTKLRYYKLKIKV